MMAEEAVVTVAEGQVWTDTYVDKVEEWVSVLHVAQDHVIVQRRNGISRYPLPDFGEGQRFRFIMVEEEDVD